MKPLTRHLSRCFIAGVVALLPIGGTVLSVVWLEMTLSESWLARQPWYFPGMGIVAAAAIVYLLGLTVSTFIGRWFWRFFDRMLDSLPAMGALYRTLKQVLGYGEGKDGMFHEVVMVPSERVGAFEIGLVTGEVVDHHDGRTKLTVFIPGAPVPTAGRLVIIDASQVHRVKMPVSDSLKAIVSVGKTDLDLTPRALDARS
jgi:uncharacterized membrane protein